MVDANTHLKFWLLLPIEAHLLKWSYRPQRDGYANLEATYYITSDAYPINKLEYTQSQLQLWIETATGTRQLSLDPHQLVFLKDRKTQQIRAALITFKASHLSRKVPAGKVLEQSPYLPRLRGAIWYRGWLSRFNETVSLDTDGAHLLSKTIRERFTPVMQMGSP